MGARNTLSINPKGPVPVERQTSQRLAEIFRAMADLLTLEGGNPHRIRAYRRGADSLAQVREPLEAVAARGELCKIPGIGRELSAKIEEYLKSGRIKSYEALKVPPPAEVADWATLPGLSPPIVRHLHDRLGIRTLSDLETLVRSRLLRTLPGVSLSEDELLEAIAKRKRRDSGTEAS